MTLNELGTKLGEMYNNAPKGNSVAMIHLFGIKYAKEIKQSKYTKKDIITQSGINSSYVSELTKGVKLAEYVIPKIWYLEQADFLEKTRKAYLDARECSFLPNSNSNVLSRGTSHSISSITEDLFGCYCAEKVSEPNGIQILIDPQISFKGTELKNRSQKKALLVRPDIAFIKNNIATCFFDIKTDLGYKRFELLNQAKDRNNQINTIKKQFAHYKNGKTKTDNIVQISSQIKFVYVIISQGNIRKDKMNDFIREIKLLVNVDIFVISKGGHLNSYKDISKNEINESDFNELDELINEKLNG